MASIALLLAILLPSLSGAREQARSVACRSNLAQLARAEREYAIDNDDWIPGSPWTTGFELMRSNSVVVTQPLIEWLDYMTPLRVVMYGPKILPAKGRDMQDALLSEATKGIFSCPSNKEKMQFAQYRDSQNRFSRIPTFDELPAVSYMTMNTFMQAGSDKRKGDLRDYPGVSEWWQVAHKASWDVMVPVDYIPRHSKLGRESIKVWLADGTRFYDPGTDRLVFNMHYRLGKGRVAATPPSTAGGVGREYNMARHLSYRHGKNNRMNAVFFDGHADEMRVDFRGLEPTQGGYTGSAVHPKWYYPSGSRMNDNPNSPGLHVNHRPETAIPNGRVLP